MKTLHTKFSRQFIAKFFAASLLSLSILIVQAHPVSAAACPVTTYGTATTTVQIPANATYTVWSRIKAPDATNNSYYLQVDGNTCITVGDAAIPANTWTWVDYQNGSTTTKTTMTLTQGAHTIVMVGREAGVKLDDIIFSNGCTPSPTGNGSDCNQPTDDPDATKPTVSLTAPTANQNVTGMTNLTATATDPTVSGQTTSGVAKVDFKVDNTIVNTDSTAPYTYSWDSSSVAAGSHTVSAIATDGVGNSAASTAVTITTAPPPPLDTVPPVVSLTAPAANAAVTGTAVPIAANATDNVGVTKVEFKVDGTLVGAADTTAPYSVSWDSTKVTPGAHSLTATAYDAVGNLKVSTAVNVTVLGTDPTPPTVSITAPAANATITTATTTISANATAQVGITKVEFKVDGTLVGAADTTAPYSVSWNSGTATNGAHTITATATDAAGNTKTSSAVNVTVSTTDTTKPTVSITAPVANATVSGAAVAITASATDNKAIAKVEFYADGTLVGAADTVAPYSVSWDSTKVTPGAHSLTAKATDTSNNASTSTAVSVNVNNLPPTVALQGLTNNQTVTSNFINVSAVPQNIVGTTIVNKVEFYIDGTLFKTEATAPYCAGGDSTTTTGCVDLNLGYILNGAHVFKATMTYNGGTTTSVSVNFTKNVAATTSTSIWAATAKPTNITDVDSKATEVGVKFRSDKAGSITGIRFYKGPSNTGTHVGNLWSSTGQKLASATFTNETASGWQQVNFATPVTVTANTVYVASYFAPVGKYSGDNNFFTGKGVDNGSLHALASGVSGANGVYLYSATGGFPNQSFKDSNYWVDVVFSTSTTTTKDTTPPSAPTNLVATANTTNSAVNLAWGPSTDNVGVKGYVVLRLQTGAAVSTVIAVGSTPNTTYTDTTAAGGVSYTYGIAALDAAGNWSAGSNNVSIKLLPPPAPDTAPPTTPGNLVAALSSNTQAILTWTASTDNIGVTGYIIYRNGTRIGTSTGTSHGDATLTAGNTYAYTVKAVDAAGNTSAVSNTSSVTTQTPGTSGVPAPVAAGKTWQVSFAEEFNGTIYDTNKLTPCFDWNYANCTGSFNGGREWYNPSQVVVNNGSAKLIAAPGKDPKCLSTYTNACTYKSGLLSTARKSGNDPATAYLYKFTYGYVEANLKRPPQTPGFFTAFWMLPADTSYTYDSEIDIAEMLGYDASTNYMTYHIQPNRSSNYSMGNGSCPKKRYDDAFHRFGVDWQPGHVAWYIDGVKCGQYTGTTETKPMQIILDLMVDHQWERDWGYKADPTLTRQLEVDYIRVYQQK